MKLPLMKMIGSIAATVALGCATSPAHASSAAPGLASVILGTSYGVVIFNQSGARTTPPSCQGATIPTRWAIDVTTPSGQAMAAVLLSDYAQNKQIIVVGSGACSTAQPDTETVVYLGTPN